MARIPTVIPKITPKEPPRMPTPAEDGPKFHPHPEVHAQMKADHQAACRIRESRRDDYAARARENMKNRRDETGQFHKRPPVK
jgi:hypothetical protein